MSRRTLGNEHGAEVIATSTFRSRYPGSEMRLGYFFGIPEFIVEEACERSDRGELIFDAHYDDYDLRITAQ